MKNKRNTFFKTIFNLIAIFAIMGTTTLNALQGPPGGPTDTLDSLPLDGGLIALLIGAVAFGVKKLYDNKNNKA
ncbi:PID-CTERM protein-sorting domain-containing protein [Algibacter luteus]|uniref:Uncharacterized protein n=1 Tax=Algibacter luteus TaxID=1178825 RepID=A0A1M6H6E0_9FLAO|nr:hypothetical protein [Algibacter luteus]WJJ96096.1 hypothetical protein O5O44_12800 [Algibacter luteus]SHJ17808.1 hypothetical protein SAMN05216261_3039 [Algibacter luteus]